LREQAYWWLRAAKRDLARAETSLSLGDRAASVFWAQQAGEKALKALHIALKGAAPRTHNLRRLLSELGLDLGLSEEELEDVYELTQYYYVARYPDVVGGLPDEAISRRTAGRMVEAARRVVEAAERVLEEVAGGGEGVG